MEYYDIDMILAYEEKITVRFQQTINNFGFYISPSKKKIGENVSVDIPYFLVEFLVENGHCHVLDSPIEKYKDDFEADPSIVCLKSKYFYTVNSGFNDTDCLSSWFYHRMGTYIKYIVDTFPPNYRKNMSAEEIVQLKQAYLCFREFRQFANSRHQDY